MHNVKCDSAVKQRSLLTASYLIQARDDCLLGLVKVGPLRSRWAHSTRRVMPLTAMSLLCPAALAAPTMFAHSENTPLH